MLKISEIFEFSRENSKFRNFERILTELRSEKFEWFDPPPIEPFNLGAAGRGRLRDGRRGGGERGAAAHLRHRGAREKRDAQLVGPAPHNLSAAWLVLTPGLHGFLLT